MTFEESLAAVEESSDSGSLTASELQVLLHDHGKELIKTAGEFWIATEYEDDDALTHQAARLIRQMQLILTYRRVRHEQLAECLGRLAREGIKQ